ncbi:HAMP domain-containing histidine kinase [bacterium]|nr:HAMP domain-containing histidine kinase [bacterium]
MQREINCRTSNTLIQYFKKYRPRSLTELLAGFDMVQLTNEHHWISADEMDILYLRAEKIFKDDHIMFKVGQEAVILESTGIVDLLIRLDSNPVHAIKLSVKYAALFSSLSKIKIREMGSHHAVIERHPKKKMSRGACDYTQGLYQSMLDNLRVKSMRISETQCSVPLWEKGVVADATFSLEQGKVWRTNLGSGVKEAIGAPDKMGVFHYAGIDYGTSSCMYRLEWKSKPGRWSQLVRFFSFRNQQMEKIKKELFYEYEIVEKQNRQLRRNNNLLEKLLEERIELSQALEKKVTARTIELEDTITQLKDLDEMKSYFLSITSHELRTPLTIIKGALNLLLTDGTKLSAERYKKYLSMAKSNADHLNLLITNLLDLSRLESGQMKLEVDHMDMVRLVRESMEEFREIAKKSFIRISGEIDAETPRVLGDTGRIKQVLDNLLSNAMKFTPAHGEVKVKLNRVDESRVEIQVSDTGIGIEAWEKEKIFRKFQQAERSLTRESAGIGLGLTIVRDLIELHEGRIWVESEKGQGATFFVQLPIDGPKNIRNMVKKKKHDDRDPSRILRKM